MPLIDDTSITPILSSDDVIDTIINVPFDELKAFVDTINTHHDNDLEHGAVLHVESGLSIIMSAGFGAGVDDRDAVYWDNSTGKFEPALADGTIKQNVVGIADTVKNYIYAIGQIDGFISLTDGSAYYLSPLLEGNLTADKPAINVVELGFANSATTLIVKSTGGGGGGAGDLSAEEMIYRNLLNSLPYEHCHFETFQSGESLTLSGSPIPSYDSGNSALNCVASGGTAEGQVLSGGETLYHFYIHEESDSDNFTAEYSTNEGGSWTSCNIKNTIYVSGGFTTLDIRFTWTGADNLTSYGVCYDFTDYTYTTDTRMWEATTFTLSAGIDDIITLPNNARYTVDGKSLEIYNDGTRLINGVDFIEVDETSVQTKIDVTVDTTWLFTEKYGLVDYSFENKERIDNAEGGFVKAWVNFNGTGTVAIRDSFNVSSITDNGIGDYTINFTTAFANANYCMAGSTGDSNLRRSPIFKNYTVGSVEVNCQNDSVGLGDEDIVCGMALGDQ